MGTSASEIRQWFESGVEQGATHMIVVCDTYDWEDYPIYVMPGQNAQSAYDELHGKNMQKVMEVYKLTEPADPQIGMPRCFNF